MRYFIIAICLFTLAGCGLTSPQNLGNAYKYTLSPVEPASKSRRKLGDLVLDFPKANAELDTYRIALLRDEGKRDYFAGARWADFLPVVVQSTMVESLQNSGRFNSVTSDQANFSADYQLQGDVRVFEADYTASNPPTIKVKVYMTLTNLRTLRIVKSFTIEKESVAKSGDLGAIYKSFDTAFTEAQKDAMKQIIGAL